MEKLANALNERFVAAVLDRVVPNKSHAAHTVGEKTDALRSAGRVLIGVPSEPLQGIINRADFPSVVGGTGGSYPVELSGSPQQGLRGVGAVSER